MFSRIWSASIWYASILQIVEIFRVIEAKPYHHVKVADLGGDLKTEITL